MLDFDIKDTVAGRQIFEEGVQEGKQDGKQEGFQDGIKEMVIEALVERFVAVPPGIRESVYSIGDHKTLKELHRYAIRSPHVEDFRKILAKVFAASKGENTAGMSG